MTRKEKNIIKKRRNDVKNFLDEYYSLCQKYNLCLTEFTIDNSYENLHVFQCNLHVPPCVKFHKKAMLRKFDAEYKQWYEMPLSEKEKVVIEKFNESYSIMSDNINMTKLENFFKEMKGK